MSVFVLLFKLLVLNPEVLLVSLFSGTAETIHTPIFVAVVPVLSALALIEPSIAELMRLFKQGPEDQSL